MAINYLDHFTTLTTESEHTATVLFAGNHRLPAQCLWSVVRIFGEGKNVVLYSLTDLALKICRRCDVIQKMIGPEDEGCLRVMIGTQPVVHIQVWKLSCVLEAENWRFTRAEVVAPGGEV